MPIVFHKSTVTPPKFKRELTRKWLANTAITEGFKIKNINYVFMSDEELLHMNIDFLQHDYYTDIITFDNSNDTERSKQHIVADIFISIDRIKDNAINNNVTFTNELMRVMVHGLLHLCNYADKTKPQQTIMRSKEDQYLAKLLLV
jgi:probable rRNA maturation factor